MVRGVERFGDIILRVPTRTRISDFVRQDTDVHLLAIQSTAVGLGVGIRPFLPARGDAYEEGQGIPIQTPTASAPDPAHSTFWVPSQRMESSHVTHHSCGVRVPLLYRKSDGVRHVVRQLADCMTVPRRPL